MIRQQSLMPSELPCLQGHTAIELEKQAGGLAVSFSEAGYLGCCATWILSLGGASWPGGCACSGM